MAERRMLAQKVIDSDFFLDMPLSAQCLYFHLSMRADDDGFVGNPKKIQRMIGCTEDDIKLLIAKQFIIPFNSGVIVIRHWRIHNYIAKDRYKETIYTSEKSLLTVDKNNAYTLDKSKPDETCIQDVYEPVYNSETQVRLGKVSIGKINSICAPSATEAPPKEKTVKRFFPPSVEEVKRYCVERGNNIDAAKFVDYYTANGWKVGKNPMKDWKAAVRTWERNNSSGSSVSNKPRDDSLDNIF